MAVICDENSIKELVSTLVNGLKAGITSNGMRMKNPLFLLLFLRRSQDPKLFHINLFGLTLVCYCDKNITLNCVRLFRTHVFINESTMHCFLNETKSYLMPFNLMNL